MAATRVPGRNPVAPSSTHDSAQIERHHLHDPGAPLAGDQLQDGELQQHNDRGVHGERDADDLGGDLGDLSRESREAGLHLPISDEDRQEREKGQPQHGGSTQDLPVSPDGRGVDRCLMLRAHVAERPENQSERDQAARRVDEEDRREGGRDR